MISEKMQALSRGNSVIRAMFEEGQRFAAQFGAENVFDFSLGNPNFPPPDAVKDAVIAVLNETKPTETHGYMANSGFPAVRIAVAESINSRFKTSYTEKNIIMSVGAAGAINAALKTLLNPGDEVIAFAPYFVEYRNYAENYGGELKVVPPNPPSFEPSAEALEAAITEKTKAVIINNPNNPTGVIYAEEALAKIAAVLKAKSALYGHPIVILSDEPYRELNYTEKPLPWIPLLYQDTIVCYSWSKSLSLPGERIGYIAVPDECAEFSDLMSALAIATRVLGFVNAPSLMQLAVARVLNAEPNLEGYRQNRDMLYRGLTEIGYECTLPEGAFYLWVKAPGGDDKAFAENAKTHNILIVPGTSFACPGYVRIAYCVAADTIKNSLPGFRKLAAEMNIK